jgi:hypothetical protein
MTRTELTAEPVAGVRTVGGDEIAAFIEPWAETDAERQESAAAARAYVDGDFDEVDRYLKRRHERWTERRRGVDRE